MQPYLRGKFHPGEWRRRKAFGTGTLGDMGCHIFSPSYRSLGLTSPVSITSHGPTPTRDNWAVRAKFHYVFPGTPLTEGKAVDYWWYDGTERPPSALLDQVGARMPQQGNIFVGADGIIVLPHGGEPFALPAEKFKDAKDPLRLVFLCAMWLTGFDVPSCSTIYLDKPMRNHTLMQTIARANRVFPGKHSGVIVDYANVFASLEKALAIYAKGQEAQPRFATSGNCSMNCERLWRPPKASAGRMACSSERSRRLLLVALTG
jgi:hypothetical protein